MKIELTRQSNDLEIYIEGQCVKINEYYKKSALSFIFKRRDRQRIQHELHILSGWLAPAIHIKSILSAADALQDGWRATGSL